MFIRFVDVAKRWLGHLPSQALAEYLFLVVAIDWRFSISSPVSLPWHAAPATLVPWFLLRWAATRRHSVSLLTALARWGESHATGLTICIVALKFFFDANLALLSSVAAWTFAIAIVSELAVNDAARATIAAWSRRRLNVVWPRMGIVAATVVAVWVWDRMALAENLPPAIYAWIVGATSAVTWATRRSGNRWRAVVAPLLAVLPIFCALYGTPAGQPIGRLFLLVAMALIASWAHAAVSREQGKRSAQSGWFWFLGLAGLWLCEPLINAQAVGAGDAQWYTMVMADAITQWHAGIFPPFVGQSIYAFSGSSFPGCFASYYQVAGIVLDGITGGVLSAYAIQHATAILSVMGGIFSTYFVLRALTRGRRGPAALVALLYAASPAWLGALYSMDMYMTVMTLPWLPLVVYGCAQTFAQRGPRAIFCLVVPLSILWYAHPPVAVWASLAVAVAQAVRLATNPRPWRVELSWFLGAGTLFLALTCLPFASAWSAKPSVDTFRQDYVIETMAAHWAAAWKPVSSTADRLNDQHLGWSLALVALVGASFALRKNQRSLRAMIAATGCLLFLIIPFPIAQAVAWQAMPETLKSITNNWPTQRIYPVLASLTAVACGAALIRTIHAKPRARAWMMAALCGAVAWSFSEAFKFQRRGHTTTLDAEASARRLFPENLVLTRYAYDMFSRRPDYVANGVMSPSMKHRLLDENSFAEITTNFAAASTGAKSKIFTVRNRRGRGGEYELVPMIRLRPGRHYLLEFNFESRDYLGNLLLNGDRVERLYHLPSDGGPSAFGSGPSQGKFITLWTSGNAAETVRWSYQSTNGVPPIGRFARVRMTEIEPERLPVRIESLLPYQAAVRTTQPSWLETPRMFLPGYEATVAGAGAEVRESPQGLLMVRVPAGDTRVELRYVGPTSVRCAFWVAATAWLGVIAILLGRSLPPLRMKNLFRPVRLPQREPAETPVVS